jgi:hypothetical protein
MITTQPKSAEAKHRDPKLIGKPRQNIRFFCDIEIPDGVEQLHLSDNSLIDFVGLPDSDSLADLVLDRNPIISFRGFPTLSSLQHLSLRGTPVSKLQNFRALAVLCAGDQLTSLNGQEVTAVDRAAAKAYQSGKPAVTLRGFQSAKNPPGPLDTDEVGREFIVRGWIPREPIAFAPTRRAKTKKPELNEIIGGWNPGRDVRAEILALVDRQEQDPLSVQITRTLRCIGYAEPEIGAFLRRYFGPPVREPRVRKVVVPEPDTDGGLERQQRVIETLAMQLHSLRSGNRTLTDYEAMVADAGRRLIENRTMVAGFAGGESATVRASDAVPDYETLRNAVVAFLGADQDATDADLIDGLNARDEASAESGEEEMSDEEDAQDVLEDE